MISLLFVSDRTLWSKVIRLFTNFKSTIKGEFVPSHVAIVAPPSRLTVPLSNIRPSHCAIVEMLGAPYGLVKNDFVSWVKRNEGKNVRVVEVPVHNSGNASKYYRDLKWFVDDTGHVDYESLPDFVKMAFKNNPVNNDSMTCSEFVARAINKAAGIRIFYDPENTSPDDIYKMAKDLPKYFQAGGKHVKEYDLAEIRV